MDENNVSTVKNSFLNSNFFWKKNHRKKEDWMQECLMVFDEDKDGALNFTEFEKLLSQLFCDKYGVPYYMPDDHKRNIFEWFDQNKDELLDAKEFRISWLHWISQILNPVSALLIIDVQNDFISGTLAIKYCPANQDGADVVPVINQLLDNVHFDAVVYSLDWHPENHCSFIDNIKLRKLHDSSKISVEEAKIYDTVVFEGPPVIEQKLWPAHCIQGSWGAQLHENLKEVKDAIIIKKGVNPEIDSYSAFWDNKKLGQTELMDRLLDKNITDIFVCGIAYDVCVGFTALDALQHGLRTILIDDASKGINMDDIGETRHQLIESHAVVVSSNHVLDLVTGQDRPAALGYQAALRVSKELNLA